MSLRSIARSGLVLGALVWLAPALAQVQAQAQAQQHEVQVAPGRFSLAEPVPSWVETASLPDPDGTRPFSVRLFDTQFLIGDAPAAYVHRAVAVNDASVLGEAGHLPIPFDPNYQRLQVHAIRVWRDGTALDRTASSPLRFVQREPGLERGVYIGEVTASFLIDDLRVGDTLEYLFTIHGRNPVFAGRFAVLTPWNEQAPIIRRRAVLHHPVGRPVGWRMIGDGPALAPQASVRDGLRRLVFEEHGLARVFPESQVPPDHTQYRSLQASEFADWREVGGWAADLFRLDEPLDADVKAVAERLRALPGDEERIEAALRFVQSEIRYFSVSLGESSHRPAHPNAVLKRRFGDCKDKSLLLIALLGELGIRGEAVLVDTTRSALDKMLPSASMFDHVIVGVPQGGRTHYLDPTRLGQQGRLSRMGQAHEGARVLPARADAALVTIATPNISDLVTTERSETATITKFGADGELRVRQVWNGTSAENLRAAIAAAPREQIARALSEPVEQRYPGARPVRDPEIADDARENTLTIVTVYTVPDLAKERNGTWYLIYEPSNLMSVIPGAASLNRTAPLHLPRFPFTGRYSFEVVFPDNVKASPDTQGKSVRNAYFDFAASSYFTDNISKTMVSLRTLGDRIRPEDFKAYMADIRGTDEFVKGVVYVRKEEIGAAGDEPKAFGQMLRSRMRDTIADATRIIASGRLSGADLASVYTNRGGAHANLDQVEDAFRDLAAALKLAPKSIEALAARADLHFQIGKFDKAIADQSRAVALGATEPRNFQMRGMAHYYAGRFDAAAADFLRGSDTVDRDAQLYSDIWTVIVQRRLGRPVPEALMLRAKAEPRGDWPRPVLAMLCGHLSPEEMLRLVEEKKGDDRHITRSEASFYLAQRHLLRGDKAKARELFAQVRAMEASMYFEYLAAKFELERLSAAAVSRHGGGGAKR